MKNLILKLLIVKMRNVSSLVSNKFLICTILTLIPNYLVFKNSKLSKQSYEVKHYLSNVFFNHADINDLIHVLNKDFLRELVDNLLIPLLYEIPTKNISMPYKHWALKNYLNKYNYIYNTLFFEHSFAVRKEKTTKELNQIAIIYLFLLAGL